MSSFVLGLVAGWLIAGVVWRIAIARARRLRDLTDWTSEGRSPWEQ